MNACKTLNLRRQIEIIMIDLTLCIYVYKSPLSVNCYYGLQRTWAPETTIKLLQQTKG